MDQFTILPPYLGVFNITWLHHLLCLAYFSAQIEPHALTPTKAHRSNHPYFHTSCQSCPCFSHFHWLFWTAFHQLNRILYQLFVWQRTYTCNIKTKWVYEQKQCGGHFEMSRSLYCVCHKIERDLQNISVVFNLARSLSLRQDRHRICHMVA